jgi:hypothetical protein
LVTAGRQLVEWLALSAVMAVAVLGVVPGALAPASHEAELRAEYDRVLDEYVRDGLVYYRAVKSTRQGLDAYVQSLSAPIEPSASPEAQMAFWLNAYNALVLKTVVDHYPIATRSTDYPAHSIRQIPGAFDGIRHQVGGRGVTLNDIEQVQLAPFHDPRLYLALGRGAVGSGRLRSEAFDPARIDQQLAEVAAECATRAQCFHLARAAGRVRVSAIFSWRSAAFIEVYDAEAPRTFARRSPIERSVIGFLLPQLFDAEREYLAANTFKMEYMSFDWDLNEMGRR